MTDMQYQGVSACPAEVSDVEMGASDDEFAGVSACPAEVRVPRKALLQKTNPRDAFDAGHIDAYVYDAHDEFNLELELEAIMDNEELCRRLAIENANVHGGFMLQIGDLHWCSRCGASATLGHTSRYLRELCKGKPPNKSMRQRRNRLIRKKHPTTCAPLHGDHKRIRYI